MSAPLFSFIRSRSGTPEPSKGGVDLDVFALSTSSKEHTPSSLRRDISSTFDFRKRTSIVGIEDQDRSHSKDQQQSLPPSSYNTSNSNSLTIPATLPGTLHDLYPSTNLLTDLVSRLRLFFGPTRGLTDLNPEDLSIVFHILRSYRPQRFSEHEQPDWKKYAVHSQHRYTRNLVDDGNGAYNLILLVWGSGHGSAIHDHSGSHCCMKIISGEMEEKRYEEKTARLSPPKSENMNCDSDSDCEDAIPPSQLALAKATRLKEDDIAYMHDAFGYHSMGNVLDRPSITLHLYTPPIAKCKLFQLEKPGEFSDGFCSFDTINGEAVHGEINMGSIITKPPS